MRPPPPLESPEPPHDPLDTPSGVYRAVKRTSLSTQIQWGAIGAIVGVICTGVGWTINKVDLANEAAAQTRATANTALEASKTNSARIEAVDAGTRMAIERLERKIDSNNEATERKLSEILREVKKR